MFYYQSVIPFQFIHYNSNIGKCLLSACCLFLFVNSAYSKDTIIVDDDNSQKMIELRQTTDEILHHREQQIIDDKFLNAQISDKDEQQQLSNHSISHNQLKKNPERAVFLAINQQNWRLLTEFLNEIDASKDKALISQELWLFAKASLARGQGNIKRAIKGYQAVLAVNPNFVRAKLDLARTYYQDKQIDRAKDLFASLTKVKQLPPAVHNNIARYQQAIASQQALHSRISFGIGYENNINQSSEHSSCLLQLANGLCGYERSTPKAIDSSVINYELMVNKDWHMADHHAITTSLLSYGDKYRQQDAQQYDNNTLNMRIGYRYQDHNSKITLAPLLEYRYEDNDKHYQAVGASVNLQQNMNAQLTMNRLTTNRSTTNQSVLSWLNKPASIALDLSYKDYQYTKALSHNDGQQFTANASAFINSSDNSQWFANLLYVDRDNIQQTNDYQKVAVGMGQRYLWDNGLLSTLRLQNTRTKYHTYNAILANKRKDSQWSIDASLSAPPLSWQGFEPSLNYSFQHNQSNIDWLYDFDSYAIAIKFQRVF